jgi:RNA polymerase sigma-70 factor (ECF subfamily)
MTGEQERQAAALMQRAQAGDQTSYGALLLLLASVAARFVRARIGSQPWADDVVQETLMTVHRVRHTYDVTRPFAPWFYAIVSSRVVDVARRERRIAGREIATDQLLDAPAARTSGRGEIDADRVRAALAALPAKHRAVIEGLKYRDESVRETAARLEMSEAAVKVTAHRGYRMLRRLLGKD